MGIYNEIKATELRIGNIVLVDNEPRRVEGITKRKIAFHYAKGESRLHYCRMNEVKGAPLKLLGMEYYDGLSEECKELRFIHNLQNYYYATQRREFELPSTIQPFESI